MYLSEYAADVRIPHVAGVEHRYVDVGGLRFG
jgi:hypothetical protein